MSRFFKIYSLNLLHRMQQKELINRYKVCISECRSKCTLKPKVNDFTPGVLSVDVGHLDGDKKNFHTCSSQVKCCSSPTKALTIWKDIKEVKSSPFPALSLGISGLVPFAASPVYMIMQGTFLPVVATAQIAYGACILSFLGGVRWGITLPEESYVHPDWTNLGYSVIPSLIAWAGLLMPSSAGLLTIMGGLGLAAYYDLLMYGYPAWFKGLRFVLSFFAILSLWSTFMCSLILKSGYGDGQVSLSESAE